jgi:hypothetical protein
VADPTTHHIEETWELEPRDEDHAGLGDSAIDTAPVTRSKARAAKNVDENRNPVRTTKKKRGRPKKKKPVELI